MGEVQTEYLLGRPAPHVAPFVEHYVGYRLVGFPPGLHRGLPSRHMTLIVSIGDDIDVVAQTDPSQTPSHYRCVVGGLQDSHALVAHDGNQEGVEIELTPVGCRSLLGLPAAALWNLSLELDDVIGSVATELWERLQTVGSWRDRFAACDDVFGRLLGDQLVTAELQRSWELLVASAGDVTVADIADDVGWSRQHLARRFKDEFGLSPKLAARVVRFERARRMLQASPPFVSIAQVAATCGYYDQAHLTRDFVELAGCPPGRLLVEEDVPSFQDPGDLIVAP
ncbi:MAG: helix-turn-helix domain-containing protein [Acidimicrobiales bacterium]